MRLYVFDLDGTIANIDHRLKYLAETEKNWSAFFGACIDDAPVKWVINLMHLCATDGNLLILSGRSDEVRKSTEDWLLKHNTPIADLVMRKAGDYRSDEVIKIMMLRNYLERHPSLKVEFIVDDRQRVVDMWRREGFNVLQCQSWEEK